MLLGENIDFLMFSNENIPFFKNNANTHRIIEHEIPCRHLIITATHVICGTCMHVSLESGQVSMSQ